jgi:glycosyltransferase involved in cell wall biosynthesis
MRILFVADGRSPIALNWMKYFSETGHEIHLASTYPFEPSFQIESSHLIPVAFSRAIGTARITSKSTAGSLGPRLASIATPRIRTYLRQWIVPLSLPRAAQILPGLVSQIQPDLVHAMRVPYEGMLAALANSDAPLLISIWGNDFTLHAQSTPLTRRYTRTAMSRADALHTDCRRDAQLAIEWGFSKKKPITVLPSGGGVQLDLFYPSDNNDLGSMRVINPRGLRAYVRNDTFFQAVPLVAKQIPQVKFICPGMAGESAPSRWIRHFGGGDHVELLPKQSRKEMAGLFRSSQVAASITTHDGTPNTLLEAMACGCYPIAGDLESVREWIVPGKNGQLVEPDDPRRLADEIVSALRNPDLMATARKRNLGLIRNKAEYGLVMAKAVAFYEELINLHSPQAGAV